MPIRDESWNQVERGNQDFSFQELELMNAIDAQREDDAWMVDNEDIWRNALPFDDCLLYTSPSPRDRQKSRMPSSA